MFSQMLDNVNFMSQQSDSLRQSRPYDNNSVLSSGSSQNPVFGFPKVIYFSEEAEEIIHKTTQNEEQKQVKYAKR